MVDKLCALCGDILKNPKTNRKYHKKCSIKKRRETSKKWAENNKEHAKKYYQQNKEKIDEKNKEWIKNNKIKYDKYKKDWEINNNEKVIESRRKWRDKNITKARELSRNHYHKNKLKLLKERKEYNKEYKQQNKLKIKEYVRDYYKRPEVVEHRKIYYRAKWINNETYRLSCLLRSCLFIALKKYTKTGKIMSSKKYGIDYKAIIEHLKPFPENIELYNIHHDKPIFRFNFINEDGSTNLEEVRKAFAPENHKWMTIEEHRKLNHFKLK